jgi:hypothetical protein
MASKDKTNKSSRTPKPRPLADEPKTAPLPSSAQPSTKRQRSPDPRPSHLEESSKKKRKHKEQAQQKDGGVSEARDHGGVDRSKVVGDRPPAAVTEKPTKAIKHRHIRDEAEGNGERRKEKRRKEKKNRDDHRPSSSNPQPQPPYSSSSVAAPLRSRLDLKLLGQATSRSSAPSTTSRAPTAFSQFAAPKPPTKKKTAKAQQSKLIKFGTRNVVSTFGSPCSPSAEILIAASRTQLIYWPDWTVLDGDKATFEHDKNRSEKQLHWMVREGLAQEIEIFEDMNGTRVINAIQQAFGKKAPLGHFAFYKCKAGSRRIWPSFIPTKDLTTAAKLGNHFAGCNWRFILDVAGPGGFSQRQIDRAERFRRRFEEETKNIKATTPLPTRKKARKQTPEDEVSAEEEQNTEESSVDAVSCIGCELPVLKSAIDIDQSQCPAVQAIPGYAMLAKRDSDDEDMAGTGDSNDEDDDSSEDAESSDGEEEEDEDMPLLNDDEEESADEEEKSFPLPDDDEEDPEEEAEEDEENDPNSVSGLRTPPTVCR